MKVRILLGTAATVFVLSLSASPATADQGWVIDSFASTIQVGANGTLSVQEDIVVDFGSQQHHGIFRTIPLRYRFDGTHDRYYRLTVHSVSDAVKPLQYKASVQDDNEVIQIGDPNAFVSGVNRYVIFYDVAGVMNSFSDHDELYWNVDGALWQVPKSKVTATVIFPTGAFQKGACYQGAPGSTETCTYSNTANTATYTSTRLLGAGEEMTIVTALDKGAVSVPPPMLEGRKRLFPQDAFDVNPLIIFVSLIVLVAGLGLIARFWWLHGRDREYLSQYYHSNDPRERNDPLFHHDVIVVEFDPPQGMRPAQLGLILDESADTKDVTATIVDLAVRGYLTITDVPGKHDWVLTRKQAEVPGMLPYERTLFYGLFAGGRQQVKVSELKGTFQGTLRSAESDIYADAMSRKMFRVRPDLMRLGAIGVGVLVILAGAGLTWLLGVTFGGGLIGAAVILVGVTLIAVHRVLSTRTAAGRDLMQHSLGFRLYMNTAEKYRQQFAEKAEIFTQLLPYAIVFGCVERWARAFEGIDTSAANGWYVGAAPFQAAALSRSLESMNAGISSAIAAAPPSSGSGSGFGGGGFAGGGGGGGGGGAW